MIGDRNTNGSGLSPGGFEFGVQGWNWAEPRLTSITFFLDGTAKVSDQYGRPIKGTIIEGGKAVLFAQKAPLDPGQTPTRENCRACRRHPSHVTCEECRKGLATHAQIIAALTAERIDWQRLDCAGFPQLPAAELAKLSLPPTSLEELRKIADPQLRKDALAARRRVDGERAKELVGDESD